MDLAEWYARGRVVGLLELIDELPATARLREVVLNDPEQAALIAELPPSDEPWRPRLTEFDLHAQILTQLHGVMVAVFQQLVANAGHTPPSVAEFPTPKTAVESASAQAETTKLQSLLSQLLPKRG